MQITNCHVHLFTVEHVPAGFAHLAGRLARFGWSRQAMLFLLRHLDPFRRRDRFERYARIVEVSHRRSQEDVFGIVRGFYPHGTRFVVLPMDMEKMGAGRVRASIDEQHAELQRLRDKYPQELVPFVAVDPRREGAVEKAFILLENGGFRGIKLYPPLGYHPNHPRLRPLYAYVAERGIPVLSHCSRGGAHYRGPLTEEMLTDPVTGERLPRMTHTEYVVWATDPDNYVPILKDHPRLRLCLAHFGGSADWEAYLDDPWDASSDVRQKSWLAKIADLIRSGEHEGLYTDIAYTLFANEEYVHLLKVLLSDERLRSRVLFGSDFYVVEDAKLEERRLAVRLRSELGEDLFRAIGEENPRAYLGEA
jgi:predicted TIM-barrel fold metal-dependent hydrolase